jgi:hypothetical protein
MAWKLNYPGNRASLIAFSICGTASGQKCFATPRSIAASSTLHKTATVFASIFTAFFNVKYTGEASLARFRRDSYCSVENSISGFTMLPPNSFALKLQSRTSITRAVIVVCQIDDNLKFPRVRIQRLLSLAFLSPTGHAQGPAYRRIGRQRAF